MAENDKKKRRVQSKRMFPRVAKIPTSNTISELVEMDFVDYGDYAAFLHIRGTFRDSPYRYFRAKKKGDRTAETVRGEAISHRLSVFAYPDFL